MVDRSIDWEIEGDALCTRSLSCWTESVGVSVKWSNWIQEQKSSQWHSTISVQAKTYCAELSSKFPFLIFYCHFLKMFIFIYISLFFLIHCNWSSPIKYFIDGASWKVRKNNVVLRPVSQHLEQMAFINSRSCLNVPSCWWRSLCWCPVMATADSSGSEWLKSICTQMSPLKNAFSAVSRGLNAEKSAFCFYYLHVCLPLLKGNGFKNNI